MGKESDNHYLFVGAAVVAGVLGTLSVLFRGNAPVRKWTQHAKEAALHSFDKGETINKNLLVGGIAGGVIGAVAALLLAPKAGSELLKDIASRLSQETEALPSSTDQKIEELKGQRKKRRSKSEVKDKVTKASPSRPRKASVRRESPTSTSEVVDLLHNS